MFRIITTNGLDLIIAIGCHFLAQVKRNCWNNTGRKPFEEVSFYALSKPINSAAIVAKAIQGHWKVENNLHWVKDVNLGEDDMTLKNPNTATIFSLFEQCCYEYSCKSKA